MPLAFLLMILSSTASALIQSEYVINARGSLYTEQTNGLMALSKGLKTTAKNN